MKELVSLNLYVSNIAFKHPKQNLTKREINTHLLIRDFDTPFSITTSRQKISLKTEDLNEGNIAKHTSKCYINKWAKSI